MLGMSGMRRKGIGVGRRMCKMATELDANDTNALLNEIDVLKQRLEGVDRAKARIKKWHDRMTVQSEDTEARRIEKQTLKTVYRIFNEEGVFSGEASE